MQPLNQDVVFNSRTFIQLDYNNTHREIVEACKSGSHAAQFKLYNLYSKAMFNTCLRMVKNIEDAEDLLQNSFTDVFVNLQKFRYQSSIGAWIKRIVINNCINYIKKRRIEFQELNPNIQGLVAETTVETETNYSVKTIQKNLMRLPDGYRVVFSLYLLEGYDHGEIGNILNISEATSKSQFSRAKKKLKQLIMEESNANKFS